MSRREDRRPAGWWAVLGGVLGPLLAVGAGLGTTAYAAAAGSVVPCLLPDSAQARVDGVAARLRADPVLLDRDAVRLSGREQDEVRAAVRDAASPLQVAALTGLPEAATPAEVACALANAANESVSVVVLLGPDRVPAIAGDSTAGADPDVAERTFLAVDADRDETGPESERLLLLVDRVSGRAPLPTGPATSGSRRTTEEPGGTVRSGRGLALALGVGCLTLLVGVALLRAHRRRAGGRRTRRLLGSVRRGQATGAQIATRRAVRELGDRLERLELGRDDDTGAWQAALDAYDAASRRLDRARGRADLEQARVECSRGHEHLDAIERARAGRGRG